MCVSCASSIDFWTLGKCNKAESCKTLLRIRSLVFLYVLCYNFPGFNILFVDFITLELWFVLFSSIHPFSCKLSPIASGGLVVVLVRSTAHVASFPLFPVLYFNGRSLCFWQMFQLKTFKPLSSLIYASPSNFTKVHDRQFSSCWYTLLPSTCGIRTVRAFGVHEVVHPDDLHCTSYINHESAFLRFIAC